jgi:hypothetical protein
MLDSFEEVIFAQSKVGIHTRLINFVCDCLSDIAEDDMKPVTHLLAVDLTSKRGLKFLRHGLHYLVSMSYTPIQVQLQIMDLAQFHHVLVKLNLEFLFLAQLMDLFLTEFMNCSQMDGTKRARIGILYNIDNPASFSQGSPFLLLVKVIDFTASSFRSV